MAVTTFISKLWSARLLDHLEKAHVASAFVNRDYEGEIQNAGDTVHINTIGAIAVKDYTKNTDIADAEELATTDQTLVINQAKYFNFQVDDVDRAQAAGEIMDVAMNRAANTLVDASDSYIFGVMAAGAHADNKVGTTGAPITLTKENIFQTIIELRTKLDKKSVPTVGRALNVSPEVYALMLQCPQFMQLTAPVAENAFVNGLVGRMGGFDIYETNNAVYSTDHFELTAGVSTATTYAEQILKTEAYRMEKRFADGVKGLHVYGAKVIRPEAIAVLYCKV